MINSGSRFARHRRVEEGMRLLVQNAQQQIAAANNQQPYVQQAGNEDERIPPNIPLVPAMQEIQQPQVENFPADPIPVAGNELHFNEDNNGEGYKKKLYNFDTVEINSLILYKLESLTKIINTKRVCPAGLMM